MSGQGYEELIVLNRKLDELVDRYNTIKTELAEIKNSNQDLKLKLQERELKINELEIKYDRIKLTGALLGEGENTIEAKRKITELVREIDRCVALLNR
jgi:predicted  nucleic acid-binding Zn-ribbon protein